MKYSLRLKFELFSFALAAIVFVVQRSWLLPYWWVDFHSDFALVGLMARATLRGHFPIFFYGQNYMGGAEWLTAAIHAKLFNNGIVDPVVLGRNAMVWWFTAVGIWVFVLRKFDWRVAQLFAWSLACGSAVLLRVSEMPEMSPEYLFFGGALVACLSATQKFSLKQSFLFGTLFGFSWWINQSFIFFLVSAIWIWRASPQAWAKNLKLRYWLSPVPCRNWFYILLSSLVVVAIGIAMAGGLNVRFHSFHLKIPNAMSTARDCALVLVIVHGIMRWRRASTASRVDFVNLIQANRFLAAGFLLGYSPVWIGKLFHLYPPSYGVGLQILPVWEWWFQFQAVFFRSLPILLFSSTSPFAIAGSAILFLFLIWFGLKFRGADKRVQLGQFSVIVFLLDSFYVMVSGRTEGAPERYLYSAHFAIIILVALSVTSIAGPMWRRTILVATFASILALGIFAREVARVRVEKYSWREANLADIKQQLLSQKTHSCWGDYWTSYLFEYLTDEQVTLSPHHDSPANQVRLRIWDETLKTENPPCYLYRSDMEPNARIQLSDHFPWK